MALWDSVTEYIGGVSTSNLLVGAAAVVLAPVVVPAVLAGIRPIAKTVLQGGVGKTTLAVNLAGSAIRRSPDRGNHCFPAPCGSQTMMQSVQCRDPKRFLRRVG